MTGLPWWLHGKESTCQCRRHVQSLNWEDPLEEIATVSSVLAWKKPMDRGAWRDTVQGIEKEADTTQRLNNNNVYRWCWLDHFTGEKNAEGNWEEESEERGEKVVKGSVR